MGEKLFRSSKPLPISTIIMFYKELIKKHQHKRPCIGMYKRLRMLEKRRDKEWLSRT